MISIVSGYGSRKLLALGVGLFVLLVVQERVVAQPTFDGGVSRGNYDAPQTSEISGLLASQTSPGVLWAHPDSGDIARCFALSDHAERLATFTLAGATNVDWEDIDIGPGPEPGISYVYIGDIGDNGTSRCNVQIYRFPEPTVSTRNAGSPLAVSIPDTTWARITLVYPGVVCIGTTELFGATNAETLMLDPRNGDLYVGSKSDSQFRLFRAPAAQLVDGATVNTTEVANFNIGWRTTGGTIQRHGKEILLRGQIPNAGGGALVWWPIAEGQTIGDAVAGTRFNMPFQPEGQGEAVTFDRNGDGYFTISEGGTIPLWYFTRTSNDGPAPLVPLVEAESEWHYLDDGSDQGSAWRAPGFDDTAWAVGAGQFGFGEADEQTVINFGENASQKYTTTYFRKQFVVPGGTSLEGLSLKLVYDSGVAVYLNGA